MSHCLSITLCLVYVCVLQKQAKKTVTKNGRNLEEDEELVAEENKGAKKVVPTAVSKTDVRGEGGSG